jgi:two-component system, OmpR family, response regulator
MRILIVEDEVDVRRSLIRLLREEGYAVDEAAQGSEGLHKALEFDYDVIILDYLMPGMDGREVLRRLRGVKRTPVLMLTARNSIEDRVVGLDLGADDYLAKPFVQKELLARLRALIRRNHQTVGATITLGEVVIDTVARRVTRGGKEEPVTGREYILLEYLAHRRGAVVNRSELYEHLFDENEDTLSNLLEVHVCNLRRKLGSELIKTRRGLGYIIEGTPGEKPTL